MLTSTQYASELKICELAQGYNKLVRKSDGEEYMISPFAPVNLPQLERSAINTRINPNGDTPSSDDKVDMQEIDSIIRRFDDEQPKKRQKLNGDGDQPREERHNSA